MDIFSKAACLRLVSSQWTVYLDMVALYKMISGDVNIANWRYENRHACVE